MTEVDWQHRDKFEGKMADPLKVKSYERSRGLIKQYSLKPPTIKNSVTL